MSDSSVRYKSGRGAVVVRPSMPDLIDLWRRAVAGEVPPLQTIVEAQTQRPGWPERTLVVDLRSIESVVTS